MGHRHSPEEFGSARGVCGADSGFVARVEERVMTEKSIPVRAALLALRFYKAYLSVLFAGSCRYEPTCSRYAYEAIWRGARGLAGIETAAALPSAVAQIWI